jgi:peptidoglycan/LPS O-acetylase OafA/YrhL
VFIYHVGAEKIGDEIYVSSPTFSSSLGLNYYGAHFFVIVFFVLSGFLITHSASRPGITFQQFMIARLGRLYSVLIPSLIFSIIVSFLIVYVGKVPVLAVENFDHLYQRFLLNISFLSQTGSLCATPPLNRPFWSVSYEFMYYLVLAGTLLIKKWYKWLFLIFVFLLMGIKVTLLLPAWLIGSMLYYTTIKKYALPNWLMALLFLGSSFIILFAVINPDTFPLIKKLNDSHFLGATLFFSWNYQADYLFALVVASNIYSFFSLAKWIYPKVADGKLFNKFYEKVRIAGNCTYTLYMFHVPLLIFFATFLPYNKNDRFQNFLLIMLVFVVVYFVAGVTEWRINYWRNLVGKCVSLFTRKYEATKR